MPVREVDDHAVGTGKPGEITRAVQAAFEDALHGRSERYREWLDVVRRLDGRRRAATADRHDGSALTRRPQRRSPTARKDVPHEPTIELYDATLRDGMGGGGMTLTAGEKVRVVHALDELGVT